MGRRTRAAVMAAAGSASGVKGVAIAGYANEYLHYFTTPEEYEWQAYEGGSTVFGKYSSNLIMGDLAALAGDLVHGAPASPPVAFDPRNGVVPDTRPYESGADHGDVVAQPAPVQRLGRASFSWRGSPRGLDRPLDSAFLSVERRAGRRWRHVTDDLGLEIVWRVDAFTRWFSRNDRTVKKVATERITARRNPDATNASVIRNRRPRLRKSASGDLTARSTLCIRARAR